MAATNNKELQVFKTFEKHGHFYLNIYTEMCKFDFRHPDLKNLAQDLYLKRVLMPDEVFTWILGLILAGGY